MALDERMLGGVLSGDSPTKYLEKQFAHNTHPGDLPDKWAGSKKSGKGIEKSEEALRWR